MGAAPKQTYQSVQPAVPSSAVAASTPKSARLAEPLVFESPPGARPRALLKMPDEILEFYAFLFCQRGFRHLGMTFEQFLEVVDAIRPGGVRPSYDPN